MPFPSPPWRLRGQLWLSLFTVGGSTPRGPAGLRGIAFVDYQEPGVLSYRELLVARPEPASLPRVTVTDIWVDSPVSRDGGRSLWALPKGLADLRLDERRLGPASRSRWTCSVGRTPVAAATFTTVPGVPLRAPFVFSVVQRRDDGSTVQARVTGSARMLPGLGSWRFAPAGPLAWLHGRRPLLSLRMTDFTMTFGA